jgi:hypothetical protein
VSELIAALRHFITRDLLYVVGGGAVILSFLHLFDRIPDTSTIPTAIYLLTAGFSYGIGYAIQDGLSLTGLITTSSVTEPGWFVRGLYERFTGHSWLLEKGFDPESATVTVTAYAPDESMVELRRIISLKHIGTTLGSSGLVCTVLLAAKAVQTGDAFDITLDVAVLLLGAVLSVLGWVKGAQQTQRLRLLLPVAARKELAEREQLAG